MSTSWASFWSIFTYMHMTTIATLPGSFFFAGEYSSCFHFFQQTQITFFVLRLYCTNFAFLGQFTETPRDTVFTTEYSVRTAMEAVYGLLGVDRGVPEVWGSVYDVRELLDSSVKLMDGKSPLQMNLGPLNVIKKPLLSKIKGTVIEKLLRDHDVLRDGMI
jgi:myosin-crossreactive antigen